MDARKLNASGVVLQRSGKSLEALAAYRRALELAPEFVEPLNNIGTLLGVLGRPEESIEYFQRAISLRPDLAAVHSNFAIALYMLGRLEEAQKRYEHVLAIAPGDAEAMGHLGEIAIELGRIDEGRQLLERAIALSPRRGWLLRRWVETKPARAGDPQFNVMQASLQAWPTLAQHERMQLHFALGKAYDDMERPADAFRHLRAANALRRQNVAYDEAAALAAMQRVRSALTAAVLERRGGAGSFSHVPIFIVGFPRSGTTLVEQILAAHPQVYAAGEGADFTTFPENAALAPESLRRLGRTYVDRVMERAPWAARVTDKTLTNFLCVGAIHLALPNARIIHVRRDSIDTCFSCYAQLFRDGQPFSYDLGELGRYYAAYRTLMRHWRDALPEGAILEVRYEKLVSAFAAQAHRIIESCGLQWHDRCLEFQSVERPVLTASAAQVRRPLYATSVGRANRYAAYLGPLLDALANGPSESGQSKRPPAQTSSETLL